MMVDFESVVSDLEKDPPRGVILRGGDGVFCTGFDLNFVQQLATPEHATTLCSFMQSVTRRLQALPCPSVALIEGHAIGGGAELAVACDWRAMQSSSGIEFRQSRIGVSTGWGGGYRLVKLVGASEALKILLSSKRISADEASKLGLIDFIISDDVNDSTKEVQDWLQTMYGVVATETVHGMKRLVNAVDVVHSDESLLDKERIVFESLWGGPEQQKILQKISKRKTNK